MTYCQRLYIFMTSPYTAWCYNVLSHMTFLAYFAYFMILRFCILPGPHEAIILVMLFALVIEQVRRYAGSRGSTRRMKIKGIFVNFITVIYILALLFMSLGAVFRFVVSYRMLSFKNQWHVTLVNTFY